MFTGNAPAQFAQTGRLDIFKQDCEASNVKRNATGRLEDFNMTCPPFTSSRIVRLTSSFLR